MRSPKTGLNTWTCLPHATSNCRFGAHQARAATPLVKGLDAANRAKVILAGFRVPLVEREILEWREQSQILGLDAMVQRTALRAAGAIADAAMIAAMA